MRAPSKEIVVPGCLLKMGVDDLRERASAAENEVFIASSQFLTRLPLWKLSQKKVTNFGYSTCHLQFQSQCSKVLQWPKEPLLELSRELYLHKGLDLPYSEGMPGL